MVGTLAIIVVLFFITKITTPSHFLAKAGFSAAPPPTIGVVEQALLVSGNLTRPRVAKSRCLTDGLDRDMGPNYSGVPGGPWPWLESYVRAQKAAVWIERQSFQKSLNRSGASAV